MNMQESLPGKLKAAVTIVGAAKKSDVDEDIIKRKEETLTLCSSIF